MSSNTKWFTIHYADLSLPTSPVLLVVSESGNPHGVHMSYLREPMLEGNSRIRVWGAESKEKSDADTNSVKLAFGLDNTFSVLNNRSGAEHKKDNPVEMDCIESLIRQVKLSNLWDNLDAITATNTGVDFWKTHLPNESRPSRYTKGVESFTFNALKTMWKVFGLGGFSSKSKADLFEGFAENAVESASSEASEKFISQLPKRMIVVAGHGTKSSLAVEDPKLSIAMISRISAGSLFAADQSPDIDEKNIAESYQFIDLKDPYETLTELKSDSEMSAMETLKTLYANRKE